MPDFSSTLSTTARSAVRYSPTTSRTFSMNNGSLLSLNVSTRCGFSPNARRSAPRGLRQASLDSHGGRDQWVASRACAPTWRPLPVHLSSLTTAEPRPGLVGRSVQPVRHEPPPPLTHRRRRTARSRNRGVVHALSTPKMILDRSDNDCATSLAEPTATAAHAPDRSMPGQPSGVQSGPYPNSRLIELISGAALVEPPAERTSCA